MKVYNTETRGKEELKEIDKGKIGIYSCGPTVYSSPHIGNMYAYVVWDVLVRTLKYLGYEVKWVMNITDVGHLVNDSDSGEDKMEKGSKKEGLTAGDLAKKYENEFLINLEKLNIDRPNVMPRATEHILEQIELIKKIEKNEFTYKTSDGIYFDTSKFVDYGKFANLDLKKIKEGARVEINEEKKNPTDFALWKFSPLIGSGQVRQMEWESPWGMGFPGWHIECTAMSTKYLGEIFDIHTGGEDHIAIHHTNEIAQGFGGFGHQTANYWMHNAFITFKGGKISKSEGVLYTVFDLEKMGIDPMVFRYWCLNSHYKRGSEFSIDILNVVKVAYEKLNGLVNGWLDGGKIDEVYKKEFIEKIADDLAMPEALAVVWKMVRDKNIKDEDKKASLLDFDKVLGLKLGEKKEENIPEEIIELNKERERARNGKNWKEGDRLRELIKEKGYLVEDSKNGCKIKRVMLS